ncbi:MAG: HlyD family efflux transporter periplasmic adaptor subunit [Rubrivivax sp.]|nr:HlyD family efflux transporter periplasmic adaptor subunit [Rubrivivax sp.]
MPRWRWSRRGPRRSAASSWRSRASSRRRSSRPTAWRCRPPSERSKGPPPSGAWPPTRSSRPALRWAPRVRWTRRWAPRVRRTGAGRVRRTRRRAPRSSAGTAAGRAFAVRAPVAGRVLRVLQPSETTVALGTPLIELGDTAHLEIVAELLTPDALAARPGSRVHVERWGGPTTLEGIVRTVEPAAFTKVSALGVEEQRVRVLIDLTSPRAQWSSLGDAYRVGVRIVTLAQDRAVQVPASAVFPMPADEAAAAADRPADGAAAAHAVFVVEDGRARLRPVELGARNGGAAWVRQGLTPGQQVIVYPGAAVHDGVRVSARSV